MTDAKQTQTTGDTMTADDHALAARCAKVFTDKAILVLHPLEQEMLMHGIPPEIQAVQWRIVALAAQAMSEAISNG